jgi:hypothetical protein
MKKPRGKSSSTRSRAAKRAAQIDPDDILPEYDFSGGRRNKYAAEFQRGSAMIVLEPDVAAAFTNATEVNELLRAVASAMRKSPAPKRTRRAQTKLSKRDDG